MDAVSIIRPLVNLAVQRSQELALAMHTAKSHAELFDYGEQLHALLAQLRLVCDEFPELEAEVAVQLVDLTKPLPGCEHCKRRSATADSVRP